jgi:Zn-finger nucleic acid-binding protein
MLRQNFRESSGIVVDVCLAHGIWLDQGELSTLIEFAATGAMAEAERHSAERAETRKRLDAFGNDLRAVGPRLRKRARPPRRDDTGRRLCGIRAHSRGRS